MVGRVVYLGRVKQSNYHIHLLYTIPNRVAPRLLYKSVLLLVFGLILWKWMNGVDSLGSNQECRIDYRHSHSRVSHCLASIRKLGNRRSSEGLRSFKPSKGTKFVYSYHPGGGYRNEPRSQAYAKSTVRHRIDFLNVRNAKNASTLHAQTLVTTNS